MEKEVKARKKHRCYICNGIIQKGQIHIYHTDRMPRYNKNDDQEGIEYFSGHKHKGGCIPNYFGMDIERIRKIFKFCKKGIHSFKENYESDGYVGYWKVGIPTGEYFCEYCGKKKIN